MSFQKVLLIAQKILQQENLGKEIDIQDIQTDPLTLREITHALNTLRNNKAEDPHHVRGELLKHGGQALDKYLVIL